MATGGIESSKLPSALSISETTGMYTYRHFVLVQAPIFPRRGKQRWLVAPHSALPPATAKVATKGTNEGTAVDDINPALPIP